MPGLAVSRAGGLEYRREHERLAGRAPGVERLEKVACSHAAVSTRLAQLLERIAAASICQPIRSVAPPGSRDLDCRPTRKREELKVTRRPRASTAKTKEGKPSRSEAEAAVRTLLEWI